MNNDNSRENFEKFCRGLSNAELDTLVSVIHEERRARFNPSLLPPMNESERSTSTVIEAIKLYRNRTGVSVRDAKWMVEETRWGKNNS